MSPMIEQIAQDVAGMKTDIDWIKKAVSNLDTRLYNGGKGDITMIIKRIGAVESWRERWSGVAMGAGAICTASTVFLALIQIYNLLHGKTP